MSMEDMFLTSSEFSRVPLEAWPEIFLFVYDQFYVLHCCVSLFRFAWVMLLSIKETLLGWHRFFMGKNGRRLVGLSWCVYFWTLWNERNQRSFESKEMFDHLLKFFFLCNLLLWVRVYIDGGSLTMIDFIDWLCLSCRGGFFFFFLLPFWLLFLLPLYATSIL